MSFELKDYQKDALNKLEQFLQLARTGPVEAAFEETLVSQNIKPYPYRKYSFGEVPYACLRLPTGGGKTVLASHAAKVATRSYLERDYPIVLWLVPTNTIRTQTLAALKLPDHPYRAELDRYFDRKVKIMDIDDVNGICPQDIDAKTIVVVSTIANLRVNDTSGRHVYAHNEDFDSHFKTLDPNRKDLERVTKEDLQKNGLTEADIGKIKYSFANLLAVHTPLVIIDEAHNARTKLTFETLHRLHPACVIELTATPDSSLSSGSNVLYHVSASELKAQQMIKLPIMLTEHADWQASVRDAVLTRSKLALEAQKETEYIRPIVLFQAEPKNCEVTVEVLKEFLITELKVSPETIAIATGQQRELDNINLFLPTCPIEHIITIEALKEGWDCSFAYVFCSVKDVKSSKDVEQLLGRVLRMPFAKRRTVEALNRAYAHLASKSFAQAAQQLTDQLVNMGFEEMEIAANLQSGLYGQGILFGDNQVTIKPPVEPPLEIDLTEAPDLDAIPSEHRGNIEVRKSPEGGYTVIVKGAVDETVENIILAKVDKEKKKEHKQRIAQHNNRIEVFRSPSLRGESFRPLPQLCYYEQGRLNLLEPESFRFVCGEWSLLDYPVELPGFVLRETDTTFEVDIEGKKVSFHVAEEMATYNLNTVKTGHMENDLVVWLKKEVTDKNTIPSDLHLYLSKLVHHLIKERGFTLTSLLRAKYPLVRAVRAKITDIQESASDKGFQQLLFENTNSLEASFNYEYRFEPGLYPARQPYYQGRYKFRKHYYPIIEDIKETDSSDSEFLCAQAIDRHPKVKHWIRNLSQRDHASFKLPLANNWFYPDFVVELNDGRRLVVEYKGEGYKTNDDSREKKLIGERWAKSSGGKCLFLFAVEKDDRGRDVYGQLDGVIGR